jgi:hypothetical protein
MIAERRFDVSELGMTYFLRTFKDGKSPFLGAFVGAKSIRRVDSFRLARDSVPIAPQKTDLTHGCSRKQHSEGRGAYEGPDGVQAIPKVQ